MIKQLQYLVLLNVFISGPASSAEPDWSQPKEAHDSDKTVEVFYSKTCS